MIINHHLKIYGSKKMDKIPNNQTLLFLIWKTFWRIGSSIAWIISINKTTSLEKHRPKQFLTYMINSFFRQTMVVWSKLWLRRKRRKRLMKLRVSILYSNDILMTRREGKIARMMRRSRKLEMLIIVLREQQTQQTTRKILA